MQQISASHSRPLRSKKPLEAGCIKVGTVMHLGRHRLMCGDATNPQHVATLFGNHRATLTITSPPYNFGIRRYGPAGGRRSLEQSKYLKLHADNLPRQQYMDLLTQASRNALQVSEYVIVDIQMLANNKVAVIEWLHAMREHFADIAIWDKAVGQPAMPKNVMNAQFELLIFLSANRNPTRAISTADFRGTVRNLYRALHQRRNPYFKLHAATFPLHLPTWLMNTFDSTGSGIIFDPFCGTGTTLMACEETGRTCYAMEIEPRYCQIILERWVAKARTQTK